MDFFPVGGRGGRGSSLFEKNVGQRRIASNWHHSCFLTRVIYRKVKSFVPQVIHSESAEVFLHKLGGDKRALNLISTPV